jgi:hypothetical protein
VFKRERIFKTKVRIMWNRILKFFGLVTYKKYRKLLNDCAELVVITASILMQKEEGEKTESDTSSKANKEAPEEKPKVRRTRAKKV